MGSSLSNIVELVDPNEFEAYFNGFYYELKELTKNKENKREIINNFLKNQTNYIIYKFYYKNEFDISNYFTSNRNLENYINILVDKIDEFEQDDKKYSIFTKKRILYFLNKFKKDIELNQDSKSSIKEFNDIINKEIRRNYKNFHRLYTLLDA